MKALVHHHRHNTGDKSNIIPLYPDIDNNKAGEEKRSAQIIPLKAELIIDSLSHDYLEFCDLFAAGKKTIQQNMVYTLQLEQKLRENNIPFQLFVKATAS